MHEFDVLVVGGGASGLRAAIAAKRAGASVALISKVHPLRTNSGVAQGGLNAPLGKDDSAEQFAEDTLAAGDGLCDPQLVRHLTAEAAKEIIWLERMGVPFNRDPDGRLDLRRFGSNSRKRTCYADDRTGHIVLQVLHEQFQRAAIPSFEEWVVTSLAVDGGTCLGAVALGQRAGKLEGFSAPSVVLASGGFTRLYLPSTASLGTTGDGQCLAYKAGAALMDMEMVQFHPTVFPKKQGLLITEAVLGDGALIVDQKGGSVADPKLPRHKLSLAIHHAIENGGGSVALDLRPIGKEKLRAFFPQTQELVRTVAGLDATKDLVPVRPLAHRPMGGIETNSAGETAIAGLFAVGECACNGLNGAGRLAGNTLTEAMVSGRLVGEAAARHATAAAKKNFPQALLSDQEKRLAAITAADPAGKDSLGKLHAELGSLMNETVGLIRSHAGLQEALGKINELQERHAKLRVKNPSRIYNYELLFHLELGSMLTLAEVVAAAADARTESRGAHQRADFPERDDANWQSHTVIGFAGGTGQLKKKPVGAR